MDKFRGIVEAASRILNNAAKFCLAGMAFLVVLNVIVRITPIGPISGTFELVGYLGALLTAFALAHNQAEKGNISVEFVASRLPQCAQDILDCIVFFFGMILYSVISWRCVEEAIAISKTGEVSPTLSIPFYPVFVAIALGVIMLGLVLLTDFLKATGKVLKK